MSKLHPQSQWFVDQIKAENRPPWHEMHHVEARNLFSTFTAAFGTGPELHSVEDGTISNGDQDVPIRIFRPTKGKLPVMVYFHGGGWVLGDLNTHDTLCRNLAETTKHVVVAVDYRLAPEHVFPAALDDSYLATQFIANNAEDLDIDPERLVVAGDSAGGNLAAAVSLKARDDRGPKISKQVLIYPVIERDFETSSYLDFAEGYGLTCTTMQWFWDKYVPEENDDLTYVRLANCQANGLPRAFVLTAEFDVLRDEGESFASHLKNNGVDTKLKRYDGMLHGFVHFSGFFDDAMVAINDIGTWLEV